jgi:ribonuclease R
LPSTDALIAFLRETPGASNAREIARAFRVSPSLIPALRGKLRAIERSGELVRGADRKFVPGQPLPEIIPVERAGTDSDGLPLARPIDWSGTGEPPLFPVVGAAGEELAPGERGTARLIRRDSGEIEAEILHRLEIGAERIVGVFRRTRDGGEVIPADRRDRREYRVLGHDAAGLADNELVVAQEMPGRRFAGKRVRILDRLGSADAPGAISRMTIAAFDIPDEFPAEALAEAAKAPPPDAAGRVDLRALELVTIDDSDARDFDDAVWAEPDEDPANRGGWHIVVVIADVAHYVRPGSALGREAEKRGNSVYFPDRVVPMLPEALSNNLCSLVPATDRACVAAQIWVEANGRKQRHCFERAIMRSAARLTYDSVQEAHDAPSAHRLAVPRERIAALYGAFAALEKARRARGALELDLAEHKVILDKERRPIAVVPRTRLDSHRLIEEFMILANVAAAEELEARRQPCMYRVHDSPDPEKVSAVRDYLEELGIPGLTLTKGQVLRPALFNRVLERAKDTPEAPAVNEVVLRAQAQAAYSPNNIGHFGLALPRYAHFTSPIRRYADLLVHRALVADSGAKQHSPEDFVAVAEHISATERRAAAAERSAMDRYRAMLLSGAVGTIYAARISGVAPFGLFVSLPENGADGLIPISTLPSDYYDHDPRRHRLVGRHTDRQFALGDGVTVRLAEADPIGGRLMFRLEGDSVAAPKSAQSRGRRYPRRRR